MFGSVAHLCTANILNVQLYVDTHCQCLLLQSDYGHEPFGHFDLFRSEKMRPAFFREFDISNFKEKLQKQCSRALKLSHGYGERIVCCIY